MELTELLKTKQRLIKKYKISSQIELSKASIIYNKLFKARKNKKRLVLVINGKRKILNIK